MSAVFLVVGSKGRLPARRRLAVEFAKTAAPHRHARNRPSMRDLTGPAHDVDVARRGRSCSMRNARAAIYSVARVSARSQRRRAYSISSIAFSRSRPSDVETVAQRDFEPATAFIFVDTPRPFDETGPTVLQTCGSRADRRGTEHARSDVGAAVSSAISRGLTVSRSRGISLVINLRSGRSEKSACGSWSVLSVPR